MANLKMTNLACQASSMEGKQIDVQALAKRV